MPARELLEARHARLEHLVVGVPGVGAVAGALDLVGDRGEAADPAVTAGAASLAELAHDRPDGAVLLAATLGPAELREEIGLLEPRSGAQLFGLVRALIPARSRRTSVHESPGPARADYSGPTGLAQVAGADLD